MKGEIITHYSNGDLHRVASRTSNKLVSTAEHLTICKIWTHLRWEENHSLQRLYTPRSLSPPPKNREQETEPLWQLKKIKRFHIIVGRWEKSDYQTTIPITDLNMCFVFSALGYLFFFTGFLLPLFFSRTFHFSRAYSDMFTVLILSLRDWDHKANISHW